MRNTVLLLLSFVYYQHFVAQTITIDYQLPPAPYAAQYQPGIFSVPKTANAVSDLLNNGIYFNTIRTIDIEEAMNHWSVSNISGVMSRLEVQKPNILLADNRSSMLVIPILKMPLWLSSSSDATVVAPGFSHYNAVPPADYTTWSILMDSIVDKINNQWGINVYYEIWNEPDGDYWQGSDQEYFTFFKSTLQAIKSNHPSAKVGGPVVSNFVSSFTTSFPNGFLSDEQLDNTIIGQVIDSCVAWGTPLDFVSFHKFGVNLHSEDNQLNYLNQKLVSSGHGVVPLIVSEWNLGAGYRESELDPAYMINYTQSCVEHGIIGQAVAAWQDFEEGTEEFHGDYGLLSWGALHKPSWKALQLLDRMTGLFLNVDNSNYRNLNTIAAYNNDTLRILVSNYSLPGSVEAGFSLFFDHQISSDSLLNNGYLPSTIDSVFQGLLVLAGSDPLSLAINSEIQTYQNSEAYFQNGRDITLKFPGIIGIHSGKIYHIDSTRNNVIHTYDSLLGAGYNRTDAVNYIYPNNELVYSDISMTDSIYSIHLQPNGVALLEFHVPEITIGLSEISTENSEIKLYPNPTNDMVYFKLPHADELSVSLFDGQGKYLISTAATQLSMNNFVPGIYYLVFSTSDGLSVKKIIKN